MPDFALSAASKAVLELPQIAQLALPSGSMPRPGLAFDLFVVGQLVDNSGSIEDDIFPGSADLFGKKWKSVVDAHNTLVEKLKESPFGSRILFYTRFLDGTVLNDFDRARDVSLLDRENYRCTLRHTPLVPEAQITMGAMLRMARELTSGGSTVRMSLMLLTDGGENPRADDDTVAQTVALAEDWTLLKNSLVGVGITGRGFSPEACNATFARMGVKKSHAAGDPEALSSVTADFTTETLALMGADQV